MEREVAAAEGDGDFLAAEAFDGARPGCVFKLGARGLGYYTDVRAVASVPTPVEHVTGVILAAFERMFGDAEDSSHYTGDYSTKASEMVAALCPELAKGIAGLRGVPLDGRAEDEKRDRAENAYVQKLAAAQAAKRMTRDELLEAGRQTLIRLETSANRAALKKLSEMMFQLNFGHECYMSHEPWTLFCKYPVSLGFRASERVRRGARGEAPDKSEDEHVEFQWPVETCEDDGAEGWVEPIESSMLRADVERAGLLGAGEAEEDSASEAGSDMVFDVDGAAEPCDADPCADAVMFRLAKRQNQWSDWLHRGSAQPLEAMGLYHYCMYCYTAQQEAKQVQAHDFSTYVFADSHPSAAYRVQRLRVDEAFRVPRLCGFTMPTATKDPETNALFKAILFRPLRFRGGDEVDAMAQLVDERGSFIPGWETWFEQQRLLAHRYEELERLAGKWFSLDDICVETTYMEDPAGTGRRRPSAAEFMARITVDVVTHLDLAAGAKSGSRRATRPDAADYEGEDGKAVGHRRGGGVEAEDGAPAGRGETDVPAEGLAKMTQPMFEVPPEAVRSVAFYEERQAAPMI